MEFSAEEWEKLEAEGMNPDNIKDQCYQSIFDAIKPLPDREKELREIFYGKPVLGTYLDPLKSYQAISKMPIFRTANTYSLITDTLNLAPFQRVSDLITKLTAPFEIATTATALLAQSNQLINLGMSAAVKAPFELRGSSILASKIIDPLSEYFNTSATIRTIMEPRTELNNRAVSPVLNYTSGLTTDMEKPKWYVDTASSILSVHKSALAPVTGIASLLTEPAYQRLNIGTVAQNFIINPLERSFSNGFYDCLKATSLYTNMGEASLSKVDWTEIGGKFQIPSSIVHTAQQNFLSFSKGYSKVLKSVSAKPNWLYSAPSVSQLPSENYYAGTQFLRIVTKEETSVEEIAEETKRALPEIDAYLTENLPKIHKDLLDLWRGAIHSLRSNNPDRIRHFITSLRELFTHILHQLAPNEASKSWLQNTTYFYNGNPTREGRFLYIRRNMAGSDEVFAKFIKVDIQSTLSLINLFNSGTHKIKSEYTEAELDIILIRSQLSLRTFLDIEFKLNRV